MAQMTWERAGEYVEMLYGESPLASPPGPRAAPVTEASAEVVEAVIGRLSAEIEPVDEPDVEFGAELTDEEIWAAFVPTAV